jgi:hypothetical protein
MRSCDVKQLFDIVGLGATVDVIPGPLPDTPKQTALASATPVPATTVSAALATPRQASPPATAPGVSSVVAGQTAAASAR